MTRHSEGQRITTESDRQFEIKAHGAGWDRELEIATWEGMGGGVEETEDGVMDFLNMSIHVTNSDYPDGPAAEDHDAGINLSRDQAVLLRDFLDRVLAPSKVEREFEELRAKLQHDRTGTGGLHVES